MLDEHVTESDPGKRHTPRHHLEEDAAERVDIDTVVELLGRLGLLGRHVVGGAEERACLRLGLQHPGARPGELCETKVKDLDEIRIAVALRADDVAGLEVAVDDPSRVRGRQPVGELRRDVQRPRHRQHALLLEPIGEPQPLEQLHDDEVVALGRLPEVAHLDDVLVPELADEARLVEEARHHLFVRR